MILPNINRFQAFGIHLLLSAGAFAALVFVIANFWYPAPLFIIDGGWQGLKIVAFVDIVLGPLVTLVIYKKDKKGLKTDLTIIGVIQIACLIAGSAVVYKERPLALVLVGDSFYTISASNNVSIEDINKIPGDYPKMITLDLPATARERMKVITLNSILKPIQLASHLYIPYDSAKASTLERSINFSAYYDENKALQNGLDARLQTLNKQITEVSLYKIQGKYASALYLVDFSNGNILDYISTNE